MILSIYTDESGIKETFRSLCAVSGLFQEMNNLRKKLDEYLRTHSISELKFKEIKKDLRKFRCAEDFIKTSIEFAAAKKIRIDVLIWNIQDSRHNVIGRDDKKNLERMYFHLLRNVVETWKIFNCEFYPDENSEYDYIKISEYLNKTTFPRKIPYLLKLFIDEKIRISIIKVVQQKSNDEPLIQLADLYAGLGRFSIENKVHFKKWKIEKERNPNQLQIFDLEKQSNSTDNNIINQRFELINLIAETCKKWNISISINTNGYLKTYDKSLPINFWHYEPQSKYDKAPKRDK